MKKAMVIILHFVISLVPDNDIDGITQDNDINGADDLTVISQDNGAVMSQAINVRNDCDESSTTSEDNSAECQHG